MPIQTDEARIFLAIEAIRTNKKMSMRRAAKTYNVPFSSLRNRITGRVAKAEKRHSQHKLTESEEETVVRHVLDLDSRGFPPRIEGVEDMANLLLTTRGGKRRSEEHTSELQSLAYLVCRLLLEKKKYHIGLWAVDDVSAGSHALDDVFRGGVV